MRNTIHRVMLLTVAVAIGGAGRIDAHDGHCAHCGCAAPCQKVCRLVFEEKKVEVICWGCKCEDFCVPGRSRAGCRHCETVCQSCECDDGATPHAEPKNFVWFEWLSGGAKNYTRTKLMRKTVTMTVPSHKWVVEELCPQCSVTCGAVVPPGGETLPPAAAGMNAQGADR